MTLRPPACAALMLAALTLSACGGNGETSASNTASTTARTPARAVLAARLCPRQVGDFHRDLEALRRQLAVGLDYEQYAARVKTLNAAYAEIPVNHLTLECLAKIGASSERAFNRYIDAVNTWGECLADASCTTSSIEPVLQRKWRESSHFLAEAR